MKKLLLATTAFVMLAAVSANAADMGVRPAYAPPPAYNWTGGYWGGNIGYSWGTAKVDAAESTTVLGGTTVTATSQSQDINGVIGGVQGGYNYQSGVWVWGWETDIQASGQKGSSTFGTAAGAVPLTVTTDHKIEWFGTARTRLGFLWAPTVLVYGTAGVAYGEVKDSAALNGSLPAAALTASAVSNFKDVKAGWTAGAGIEAALGGGWSAKLEYLYIDLGKTELTTSAVATAGAATLLAVSSNRTWRDTDNIVRAGLNYRFGSGGFFGTLFGGGGRY